MYRPFSSTFAELSEIFDHKVHGIFTSLNDKCKLRRASNNDFIRKLKEWNHPDISFPKGFGVYSNEEFVIRHFACEVRYQTVSLLFSAVCLYF